MIYHSTEPSFDGEGLPDNMLRGVHDWFLNFHAKFEPVHIAAIFDGRGNWRRERYAEYKANRDAKPKDENLIAQLRLLPNELGALGLPILRHDGFEADDVIATLCARHGEEREIVIVTSDKDLCQLVTDNVSVFDPRAGVLYDVDGVEKKHGVPPHRLRELLALMGDSSDNVPGVKGCGKVRAVNCIRQTRSLPELVRKAAAGALVGITAAPQAAIAESHKSGELALWLELVSLRYDVEVKETIDDLRLAQCPSSVTTASQCA